MILLLSSLDKAKACAQALEEASHEPVELCSGVHQAVEKLQAQEFSAVILDQLLLDAELDEGEAIFKHLGSAVPVYVNFAIAGIGRVVREFRSALHRRKRELEAAKKDAAQALRQELNGTVTALLLSCEMALKVPELPQQAESKMHDVEALAREVSAKLGTA
jgi:Sec-independent protein translocase protein TatA